VRLNLSDRDTWLSQQRDRSLVRPLSAPLGTVERTLQLIA
jgi:hypothetical protein